MVDLIQYKRERVIMAAQTKEAVLQYLKDAIQQETDIVQQEQFIEQANAQHQLIKPELVVEQNDRQEPQLGKKEVSVSLLVCLAFAAVIFLLGGMVSCSTYNMYKEELDEEIRKGDERWIEFYQRQVDEETPNMKIGSWLYILGVGCILGGAWHVFSVSRDNKGLEQYHMRQLAEYKAHEQALANRNRQHDLEYQAQMWEWEDSFSRMRDYMARPLNESTALLSSFYASDLIYPKYRTLPALTSIYEYLITGRCEELTGPHGAYNLYEDEMRKDTVISQLNTVIENLEQIRQNQYMLYQQVKGIQENTAAIASELRQIKGYTIALTELTALNAYYAALNERNTRITMYHHL